MPSCASCSIFLTAQFQRPVRFQIQPSNMVSCFFVSFNLRVLDITSWRVIVFLSPLSRVAPATDNSGPGHAFPTTLTPKSFLGLSTGLENLFAYTRDAFRDLHGQSPWSLALGGLMRMCLPQSAGYAEGSSSVCRTHSVGILYRRLILGA